MIIVRNMIVSVIYAYKKRRQTGICKILLGVHADTCLVWVHVMDLVLPIRYIDLHMPSVPSELSIEGSGVSPVLTMAWNDAAVDSG